MTHPTVRPDPAAGPLELYDEALPHVYGYLLARCGDAGLAEELTAESFLAAVHAVRRPGAPGPSIPWLIGVARHKLADHWRWAAREQRGRRRLDREPDRCEDPWEAVVDRIRAREVLGRLGAHHRAALTLRYLDRLPVPEVARHLDRTVHATMSQPTAHQPAGVPAVERKPAWPPTLAPSIVVSDARRALDWYADVLGAERRGEPVVNADGTIGHAELGLGDAVLMFSEPSDLWPDVPVRAPEAPATFSSSLHLEVDDVDTATERARSHGAAVEREPADQPYGRRAVIGPRATADDGVLRGRAAGTVHRGPPERLAHRRDHPGAGHPLLAGRGPGGAAVLPGRRRGGRDRAGPRGRRPGGCTPAPAVRAAGGLRGRPGRDVPALAARRLTGSVFERPHHFPAAGWEDGVMAEITLREVRPGRQAEIEETVLRLD